MVSLISNGIGECLVSGEGILQGLGLELVACARNAHGNKSGINEAIYEAGNFGSKQ